MRTFGRFRAAAVAVGLLAVTGVGLTGCSAAAKSLINNATHGLIGGNSALNAFTSKVQNGDTSTYEVTYENTGSSPSTVTYAELPPHEFAFITTQSGSGNVEVLQNSSGEYECSQNSTSNAPLAAGSTGSGATGSGTTGTGTTGSGTTGSSSSGTTGSAGSSASKWSCLDIGPADETEYQDLFQFYTGSYWIDFLKVYSGVAALDGVHITSKNMTVNGFKLSCVVIKGGNNNPGTSTYCVTSQGILGYVASSGESSDFEIKSYSSSPPSSLFQLPAGASITTLPTTSSVATSST